jgi:hypothetical protein
MVDGKRQLQTRHGSGTEGGGGNTNEMEEGVAGEGGVAITKASQCRVSYVGS